MFQSLFSPSVQSCGPRVSGPPTVSECDKLWLMQSIMQCRQWWRVAVSSWAFLQEADVDLCREQVSILAVTPCDWSEVDADDQGEEADCVWSTVTELDLSLVCRAARMWQMIPNITCLLTGANCRPGFTFLIENLSCRHLCSSWADKTSQGVSLFGLLEKSEDVQLHRVDLDDVLKPSL